jgi:hypothetical protein
VHFLQGSALIMDDRMLAQEGHQGDAAQMSLGDAGDHIRDAGPR